jgi:hypothetical protein
VEGPSVGEGTQRRFVLEGGRAIFVEGEGHQNLEEEVQWRRCISMSMVSAAR